MLFARAPVRGYLLDYTTEENDPPTSLSLTGPQRGAVPHEPLPTHDALLIGSILGRSFADSCSYCEVMSQRPLRTRLCHPGWVLVLQCWIQWPLFVSGTSRGGRWEVCCPWVLLYKLSQDALLSGRCILAPRWFDLVGVGFQGPSFQLCWIHLSWARPACPYMLSLSIPDTLGGRWEARPSQLLSSRGWEDGAGIPFSLLPFLSRISGEEFVTNDALNLWIYSILCKSTVP